MMLLPPLVLPSLRSPPMTDPKAPTERMTAVATLIARLEGGGGPNRELDAALRDIAAESFVQHSGWKLATIGPDYDGNNACEIYTQTGKLIAGFGYPNRGIVHRFFHVYPALGTTDYTSSIDAAVRFVEATLPGWSWSIASGDADDAARASVWGEALGWNRFYGDHPVPAIALVTAALKARQAKEPGNG